MTRAIAAADTMDLTGALAEGIHLVRKVDGYINATEPFKLAKRIEAEPALRDQLGAILYHCAEALRVATLILSPAIPRACEKLWATWSCTSSAPGGATLTERASWMGEHSLRPGQALSKGEVLFMRADPAEAAPGSGNAGAEG
ncbi:MAG: hypothetical protein K2X32_10810 [Phycisphaerales bacterium]|nr:hypothetical protein [Phycisphaerales bacterium]